MPELAGMQGFDSPKPDVLVFLALHCPKCYAPLCAQLHTGIQSHPPSDCSQAYRRYQCVVGSHGQITVIELQPPGDNFLG